MKLAALPTWHRVRAACAPARTCSTSRTRRSRFPCRCGRCRSGTSARKGGRFGPHQSADTVNGKINRFENKIAWLAYFNAGIRVLDLSDPYQMKELGYYIPKTNERSHPIAMGQPTVIQINDVDIDARGSCLRVGSRRHWFVHPRIPPLIRLHVCRLASAFAMAAGRAENRNCYASSFVLRLANPIPMTGRTLRWRCDRWTLGSRRLTA